eukprot:SAG31_NODE_330_length_17593_cov_4.817891_2_plen_95_part_00
MLDALRKEHFDAQKLAHVAAAAASVSTELLHAGGDGAANAIVALGGVLSRTTNSAIVIARMTIAMRLKLNLLMVDRGGDPAAAASSSGRPRIGN